MVGAGRNKKCTFVIMQATEKADIDSCITELLHVQDTVILPGVGALEGTYKAAVVDAVQGLVHPPSKKIRFNPHLKLNDGALVDLVAKKNQWPLAKAQTEVETFCNRMRQALEKREIVEIAGVGRLYIDLEGEYKFLPGQHNFLAGSYGLPEIRFNMARRPVVQAPAAESAPVIKPRRVFRINFYSPVFWVLSLALVILAISIFFLARNLNEPVVGPITPPAGSQQDIAGADEDDLEQDEDENFVTGTLGEIVDTEGPTQAPGVRESIVIVGVFKDDINAEQLIQTLFSEGYEAYSDKKDGMTRVGIRLGVENEASLQEQIRVIQSRYNKKAWVFYPDEE